ncbi:MAG: hypothetical protein AAF570_17585, partial [Bacteroidota bacterium]
MLSLLLLIGCGEDAPVTVNSGGGGGKSKPYVEGVYMGHSKDAEYVGKESCRGCHPGKFETFVQSEMGRSWKPAKKSASSANFDNAKPVYDKFRDLYYYPFHRGEDLFLREFRLENQTKGDTVYLREEKIDYIV